MRRDNLTDIHMHVIPAVDDGADCFDVAVGMLKRAAEEEISRVIATPHSAAFDDHDVLGSFERLVEIVNGSGPDIRLMLGSEVFVDRESVRSAVRKLKRGRYPTLNGTEYVLIEYPLFDEDADMALYCLEHILDGGFIPIIAHAERYLYSVDQIYELKEHGGLIQVNWDDLIPLKYYPMTQKADRMLRDEMIDFLSTDAHNDSSRSPEVAEKLSYMSDVCSESYMEKVLYTNPAAVTHCIPARPLRD